MNFRDLTYGRELRAYESELAKALFPAQISFQTSFELLQPRGSSIVLFETANGIPIFGYRSFGKGYCYYLNTCQHLCLGKMPSPLEANQDFYNSLKRVFEWIFKTQSLSDNVE